MHFPLKYKILAMEEKLTEKSRITVTPNIFGLLIKRKQASRHAPLFHEIQQITKWRSRYR